MLLTVLPAEPLVMLMPSAKVSRIRLFLITELSVFAPQYRHIWCSIQMLSMVMFAVLEKSKTLPGPSIRDV